jgi:hypothetical protein
MPKHVSTFTLLPAIPLAYNLKGSENLRPAELSLTLSKCTPMLYFSQYLAQPEGRLGTGVSTVVEKYFYA